MLEPDTAAVTRALVHLVGRGKGAVGKLPHQAPHRGGPPVVFGDGDAVAVELPSPDLVIAYALYPRSDSGVGRHRSSSENSSKSSSVIGCSSAPYVSLPTIFDRSTPSPRADSGRLVRSPRQVLPGQMNHPARSRPRRLRGRPW